MARPRGIAEHQLPANTDAPEPARGAATPNLHAGADLGQALQAIREHQGLTLEAMAGVTRVRRAYLADIEAMRLERLPSRPFTIGYIRAYAEALGHSVDAAALPDARLARQRRTRSRPGPRDDVGGEIQR